jgi:hypothetical protein
LKHKLFYTLLLPLFCLSQNNTFSPYSRYALGELNQNTFAHNASMGGAYIALKPDSTMPIFINAGNPAAYALIKLTSLEVGGNALYSQFKGNNSSLYKWTANFSYAALGFPVANNGGACFGLMPFSNVGYDLKSTNVEANIGELNYLYTGSGGLNKAFLGYGIMPFKKSLTQFKKKNLYILDSLKHLSKFQFNIKHAASKLLSDLSVGANLNYIFGNIESTSRVEFPNSLLYSNTFKQRDVTLGDFTGNFGLQTGLTIDSVRNKNGKRRILKEKVKITFGYFMALNNKLNVSYDNKVLTYITNSSGSTLLKDTVLYSINNKDKITLPLEQGFGIGFKKAERINIVADFAITNWKNFKFIEKVSNLNNNYRVAFGVNYVPQKYAAGNGAFFKRINYRAGFNYNTGYIELKNTTIINYAITAGVGLPVGIGRLSSMVNIGVQYGQMGSLNNNLIKENYWKINFGFTFCDRWFQKFRYD